MEEGAKELPFILFLWFLVLATSRPKKAEMLEPQ
jgi:hypothetical protein